MTITPRVAAVLRIAHPARSPARQRDATLTQRHVLLMAMVTLLVVLAVGTAAGGGVAWLVLTAWHHAGLSAVTR